MGFSKLKTIWVPAVLLSTGLLAYSNTFSVPFLHDDVPSIAENTHIRSLWPVWEAAKAPWPSALSGRPVTTFTFAINYAISGENVWSYHLFNLLFHILSALLLFGIIRRTLLAPALKERFGPASTPLALAAAALWLAHPLHTNSVTFLVQRAESLMGLFYLLALYCSIRAFNEEKARKWYVLSVAACLLGMGSKEAMITAPFVVLVYDRIFVSDSFKQVLKARWWFYALLAATGAVVIAYVLTGSRAKVETVATMTTWQFFLTQLEAIVRYYLKLSLWPHPLIFDYGAPFAKSLSAVWPYALLLLALAAATIWALRRHPPAAFLSVWFFVVLSPSSSVMKRAAESISERVMYLPLAGLSAGAVIVVYILFKRNHWPPRILAAAGTIVVFALGTATFVRNRDYSSALALWTDTVKKRPDNARAWDNLGGEYIRRGRHQDAAAAFAGAVQANPGYPDAHLNLATALARTGQLNKAIKELDRAIALKPDLAHAFRIRGSVHGMLKRYDLAVADLSRAIELAPDAGAYLDRGTAYQRLGDLEKAAADFEAALRLDPQNARARGKLNALRRNP